MRWTCPKCGKKLDISNEQLIANDGVIVCPQCLLQAHQPIPKARVTARQDKNPTVSKRKPQQTINFDSETPPEYKPPTTIIPALRQRFLVVWSGCLIPGGITLRSGIKGFAVYRDG